MRTKKTEQIKKKSLFQSLKKLFREMCVTPGVAAGKATSSSVQRKKWQPLGVTGPALDEADQLELVANIVEQSRAFQEKKGDFENHLPHKVIEDARLIKGTASNPRSGMLAQMARLGAGIIERFGLGITLAAPTNKLSEIQNKQAIISDLSSNPELMKEINGCLDAVAETEASVISLHSKQDSLWQATYQRRYRDLFSFGIGRRAGKLKPINRYLAILSKYLFVEGVGLGVLAGACYNLVAWRGVFLYYYAGLLAGGMDHLLFLLKTRMVGVQEIRILFVLLSWSFGLYFLCKRYRLHLSYLSARFRVLQQFLKAVHRLSEVVDQSALLRKHLGEKMPYTRSLFGFSPIATDKVPRASVKERAAVAFLLKKKYTNQWIWLYSLVYLVDSMNILISHPTLFYNLFFELGQIATYHNMAVLFERHKAYKNRFCLPVYKADSSQACLKMKKLWSTEVAPLAPDRAVPNDVELDAQKQPLLLVMGPNGSGKSQIGLGVLRAAIMGQAFGLISAESATCTLFDFFYTFKQPKEDPHVKLSLFMREVYDVKYMTEKLTTVPPGKAFVLFDEFLNSTDPKSSTALLLGLFDWLFKTYPKHAYLMVTHNHKLVEQLAPQPHVAVTHVGVERNKAGFKPLYLLKKGISKERVGVDLLEKMIPTAPFLEAARRLEKELEISNNLQ